MAPVPTIQKSNTPDAPVQPHRPSSRPSVPGAGAGGSVERRSELITRVKYSNTLPDLPFDPKFIAYPFDNQRFVNYSTTSLERNFQYDILTEPDLGVDVELVIPNAYTVSSGASNQQIHLDIKDEKLLEDEVAVQKDQKRSRHHAKNVSWLRRTEYISTEQTRFQPQTIDKVEAKVGYSIKKKLKDEWHYSDRDSQVRAIEKTFVDSKEPISSHFAKPGVVPVEVLPVFPDFKLWKYPCAQVIFDSDPAPIGRSVPAQLEEMSQAMIRGVMDESGEQFVAYFLPTEETLAKRNADKEAGRDYLEDCEYEYRMAREYNWNVKSKATKGYEENYFFVIRDEGVYYNELETRVRLNKRRTRGPSQTLNTKLCVKHLPLQQNDYKFQRNREKELEPLAEDDEDEEEEEPEEESQALSGGTGTSGTVGDTGAENKSYDEETNEKSKPAKLKTGRRRSSSLTQEGSQSDSELDHSSGSENGSKGKGSPAKPTSTAAPAKLISDDEPSDSDSGSGSHSGSGSDHESSPKKVKSRSRSASHSPTGSHKSGKSSHSGHSDHGGAPGSDKSSGPGSSGSDSE